MINIFDSNNEYNIYKIKNQKECYLLGHGIAHWCISADDEDAEYWFNHYTKNAQLYIAKRKQLQNNDLDILAIIKNGNNIEVKDKFDEYIDFYTLNIPTLQILKDN